MQFLLVSVLAQHLLKHDVHHIIIGFKAHFRYWICLAPPLVFLISIYGLGPFFQLYAFSILNPLLWEDIRESWVSS